MQSSSPVGKSRFLHNRTSGWPETSMLTWVCPLWSNWKKTELSIGLGLTYLSKGIIGGNDDCAPPCVISSWKYPTLTRVNIKLKLTQKYGAKVNIARPDSLLCHLFLVPAVLSDSCSCNCSFVQHVVGLQHSLVRQTAANQVSHQHSTTQRCRKLSVGNLLPHTLKMAFSNNL